MFKFLNDFCTYVLLTDGIQLFLLFKNLCLVDGIHKFIEGVLIFSWSVGDFLCKLFQFTNTFSYTASIMILVVICTERYFAIIYPITCKQILTKRRLKVSFCTCSHFCLCFNFSCLTLTAKLN